MIRTLTITLVFEETQDTDTESIVRHIKEVLDYSPDPVLVAGHHTQPAEQPEVDAYKAAFDR